MGQRAPAREDDRGGLRPALGGRARPRGLHRSKVQ
jgi:hypothetical protein